MNAWTHSNARYMVGLQSESAAGGLLLDDAAGDPIPVSPEGKKILRSMTYFCGSDSSSKEYGLP